MIEKDKLLNLKNVISIREKMNCNDVQNKIEEFKNYVSALNAGKSNILITAVHSIMHKEDYIEYDVEIMIPVQRKTKVKKLYTYYKEFKVKNAVYSNYSGKQEGLQEHLNILFSIINREKLIQVSPIYTIQINDGRGKETQDEIMVDIYVSVCNLS